MIALDSLQRERAERIAEHLTGAADELDALAVELFPQTEPAHRENMAHRARAWRRTARDIQDELARTEAADHGR